MVSLLIFGTVVTPAYAQADQKPMYECLNHTHVWDKRQCAEFRTGPGGFPGGGPGDGGGLIGLIGGLLGGLTGGLL